MPKITNEGTAPVLVTIAAFDDPGISFDDLEHLDWHQHNSFPGSSLKGGELLVAMGGYVGAAAIVPEVCPEANIGRHTARVVIDPKKANKYFIWAFIRSRIGTLICKREVTGSVQAGINLEDLRTIIIPSPTLIVQRYIGDKVKHAESLRAWARAHTAAATLELQQSVPEVLPPSFHEYPRRIGREYVTPNSLSPERGRALLGHSLFSNSIPLIDLISECKCGDPIRLDHRVDGDFPYYGASGPIDLHNSYNFDGEFVIVAQDGTIGCASVARGKFWANNHVWVLKLKPEYDPDSVAAYLDRCYPFWQGMTTGSVVPKVTADNLLSVVVPINIATASDTIGKSLRTASQQENLAKRLIIAAKYFVEAIVEGVLSEDELAAAQSLLDQGDPAADRLMLSRVYEGGIDAIDTRQLFPDLDTYSETFQIAEPALADGGDE